MVDFWEKERLLLRCSALPNSESVADVQVELCLPLDVIVDYQWIHNKDVFSTEERTPLTLVPL